MNLNYTIIGQIIWFILFVWFCMKYVWQPIMDVIALRQQKIAEGLDAADKAKADLEDAQSKIEAELVEAKAKSATIIDNANKRANAMVEEAKTQAEVEAERVLTSAREAIAQESHQAREALRTEVATLAVQGAEQILKSEIDASKHAAMLNQLGAKL